MTDENPEKGQLHSQHELLVRYYFERIGTFNFMSQDLQIKRQPQIDSFYETYASKRGAKFRFANTLTRSLKRGRYICTILAEIYGIIYKDRI